MGDEVRVFQRAKKAAPLAVVGIGGPALTGAVALAGRITRAAVVYLLIAALPAVPAAAVLASAGTSR
jgi:hypothetical protein